jgi:hypothetical protein
MKWLTVVFALLINTACVTTGGERITDFTDRSVIYGWLDIEEVEANKLHGVTIYQYLPKTTMPYFNVKVVEFEKGYLYYSFAFPQGSFGLDTASGQLCILLCGNTIYNYDFGNQGDDIGKVRIAEPGVYYLGAYALSEVKTGFFEPGQFDIQSATNAPSEYDMLKAMLADAADKPAIDARLRAAIRANEI